MAYSLTVGNTLHHPGGRLLSLLERDRQTLSEIEQKDLAYPSGIVEHGSLGALSTGGKLAYAAFCALVGSMGLALLLHVT
jgi:hypothetical protein